MKERLKSIIRKLVSPSTRFELRQEAAGLREQLRRACLWRWELVRLPRLDGCPYDIIYAGRKGHRELAMALLGLDGDVDASRVVADLSLGTGFVCEMPVPRALRVPWCLRVIIPLGRTIEEIRAGCSGELRRVLRKHRARYRMQEVLDDAEVDRANREMLEPYATARHGDGAAQLGLDEVWRIAKRFGRLDLVYLDDNVVACHLGCVITRAGKRYWSSIRVGYPEAVFSDPKRLHETNMINFNLALEWALENGFDYFDMGTCLGRPANGLLQWKKRWGGVVDTMGDPGYFHVRLPRAGAAEFLWKAPLFAVERRGLTLHLGLPEGPSDEEVMTHYREMRFGGLSKVYLRCARPPGERLLEALRGLYAHEKSPPIVESIPTAQ